MKTATRPTSSALTRRGTRIRPPARTARAVEQSQVSTPAGFAGRLRHRTVVTAPAEHVLAGEQAGRKPRFRVERSTDTDEIRGRARLVEDSHTVLAAPKPTLTEHRHVDGFPDLPTEIRVPPQLGRELSSLQAISQFDAADFGEVSEPGAVRQ